MLILGIESSCDETAAAIVKDGQALLSNVVFSSMDLHAVYGGIVPEIAARSHMEAINTVIEQALTEASCSWSDLDALAVTYGAGLAGSLLIGVMSARTLAITKNLPLFGANHVLGHVYANFLNRSALPGYRLPKDSPKFPLLAVIVSGGHTQLVLFKDHFNYRLLGRTLDDAIGEAFDKVAKILGLGYPGGPAVSAAALNGQPDSIPLPIAKVPGYNFSFSGLKTALLRRAQELAGVDYTFPSFKLSKRLNTSQKANLAASFECIAVKTIVEKVKIAAHEFNPASVVLAGGVAANSLLRHQLAKNLEVELIYPDVKLCTDNGAMIAALGCFMSKHKRPAADAYTLDIEPSLII